MGCKLTLPRFKGGLTAWTTFWDLFKSTVHENNGISKVNKFNYLKSLLEVAAARTIQGLMLSDGSYDSAISMLVSRGQTAIFSFCVGAGKYISHTKVVLTSNRFWLGVDWIHVTYSPK